MNIICKHCGSEEGFYIKTVYYSRSHECFNSDGSSQFSGTADSMQCTRGKNVYCISCDKVIFKVKDIEDELEN